MAKRKKEDIFELASNEFFRGVVLDHFLLGEGGVRPQEQDTLLNFRQNLIQNNKITQVNHCTQIGSILVSCTFPMTVV